jgi:hypothetical protein
MLDAMLVELEREVAVVASTTDLLGWLRKHLGAADTDLLRELVVASVLVLGTGARHRLGRRCRGGRVRRTAGPPRSS